MLTDSVPNLQLLSRLSDMFDDFLGADPTKRAIKYLKDEFVYFAEAFVLHIHREASGYEDRTKLVSQAANRMIDEWHTINRACEQRQLTPDAEGLNIPDKIATATQRAKHYYDVFQGFKFKGDEPVVYFDKQYHITRYAFTPYALIALPLPALLDEHWEALAHELGHHIYWNSFRLNRLEPIHNQLRMQLLQNLRPTMLTQPDSVNGHFQQFYYPSLLAVLWMRWLEETFADVCGTLMAGPAYVQSSMDLAETIIRDGLEQKIAEDDEHPSPFIRPLIAIQTMEWALSQGGVWSISPPISNPQDMRGDWKAKLDRLLLTPKGKDRPELRTVVGLTEQQISRSIGTVVKTILETPWVKDEDGKEVPFGQLFMDNSLRAEGVDLRAPIIPLIGEEELRERVKERFKELIVYLDVTLQNQGLLDEHFAPDELKRRRLEFLSKFDLVSVSGRCKKCKLNSNGCCIGCG